MIGAVKGKRDFSTSDHIRLVKGYRWDGKKERDATNDTNLQGIFSDQGAFERIIFPRAKHMSAWLSIQGTTFTVTVLATTEFCGF